METKWSTISSLVLPASIWLWMEAFIERATAQSWSARTTPEPHWLISSLATSWTVGGSSAAMAWGQAARIATRKRAEGSNHLSTARLHLSHTPQPPHGATTLLRDVRPEGDQRSR